jgi:hypothetical protein
MKDSEKATWACIWPGVSLLRTQISSPGSGKMESGIDFLLDMGRAAAGNYLVVAEVLYSVRMSTKSLTLQYTFH